MTIKNAESVVCFAALSVVASTSAADANSAATIPTSFRLLPMGRFRASDASGRPEEVAEGWLLTPEVAAALVASFSAKKNNLLIDYDHQTLNQNGQIAPAAGWIAALEARPDGLWASGVTWTARAAALIAAAEYRYISPVFSYDPQSGQVLSLAHIALTNYPGLDGLTDLARAALSAMVFSHPQLKESPPMKALLAALGLAPDAKEADALTALAALKATPPTNAQAINQNYPPSQPDPAQFVPVAVLSAIQTELQQNKAILAALQASEQQKAVDATVADGLASGALTKATEAWARELGKSNLAALQSFITAQKPIAALSSMQSAGVAGLGNLGNSANAPNGKEAVLSADAKAVCARMNITVADFAAAAQ